MSKGKLVVAALVMAAAVGSAAAALAYVRSTTEKSTPVFWPGTCTWIAPDVAGSPDLPAADVIATLTKAIANWQSATLDAGCSYLRIMLDPAAPGEAKLDRKNVLKFRTDKWCRPAETNNAEMCYSSSAAAITTVFYTSNFGHPDDGAIIDADIQMNDINFTFVIIPPGGATPNGRPGTQIADLENTLTHELGHFQGLDHTCWDMAPPHQASAPISDTGEPILSCVDVANKAHCDATGMMCVPIPLKDYLRITEATMYNYAMPGEIIKRSPSADDINGICGVYPVASDPKVCERPKDPNDKGCTIGSHGDATTPLAALLALATLGLLLRRRRA